MIKAEIGLVAATPKETVPLLKMIEPYRHEKSSAFQLYRFSFGAKTACLIESGMGPANAAAATRHLIETASPEIIINFGFAGALSPGMNPGDLVLANRLLSFHEKLFSEHKGLDLHKSALYCELLAKLDQLHIQAAAFVTTDKITSKKEVAGRLPAGIKMGVLEMESSAIARIALHENIPVIAIRAISDSFDDELGFSLEEFCDKELKLKIWRVVLTVARKPWIIPQLVRLSGNSKLAGINLSRALFQIITSIAP